MNSLVIDGSKLQALRYSREISAADVADLIDSSTQYVLKLEKGNTGKGNKLSRTSKNFLSRLALVYGDAAVAECIVNEDHRQIYLAHAAKRRALLERLQASGK